MHRFLATKNGTTCDANKDIYYSTRYDDRELIKGYCDQSKLDWLSKKIDGEITLCSHNIPKLERLQERYESDGVAAQADDNIAYYMRYVKGYDRINIILTSYYNSQRPVSKEGKLNVDSIHKSY